MIEDESQVVGDETVDSGQGDTQPRDSTAESGSDQVADQVEVIYTDQLTQIIEAQQVQLGVSLVFVGLFLVSLLATVWNRYL
jgi:hypothetical protein